ncbi:MAG: anti-sigma factor antagonist [Candidatus Aminicenantes bacterium]|nr:anti-sigma factor antagonist [Candidatus Aminicenantes bacterium]
MDIKIRELNDIVIIDIGGDIRQYEVKGDSLYQHVKDQLYTGKRNLLINFEKVDFIDSLGVGDLLSSYVSTNNLGGKIKLMKVAPRIQMIFQVTLLDRLFEFFEDEEAAIKSFR